VEGEILLEKYDKLIEVMRPKQLKPAAELAVTFREHNLALHR